MLLPVDETLAVPVTLVVLGAAPEVQRAVLIRVYEDRLLVVPERDLETGLLVVVTLDERDKLAGRVIGPEGAAIAISRDHARSADDRAAPRVPGHFVIRWRPAPAEVADWLAGRVELDGFTVYSGESDLSLSGLRVPAPRPSPRVGVRLLVEIRPHSRPGTAWRAVGVLRRVDVDEDPPSLGIEFVELPERTFEGLSEYTLASL